MSPILKGIAAVLSAAAAAYGISLFVSPSDEQGSTIRGRLSQLMSPMRKAMNRGTCDERTTALAGFSTAVQDLAFVAPEDSLQSYLEPADMEFLIAYDSATSERCAKEAYNECVEKHDFSRLWLLGVNRAREQAYTGRDETGETDPLYDELLDKCLSFELEFESLTLLPPLNAEIRAKSLVRLSRDKEADQQSAYILSGEAPLTPSAQARMEGCGLEGPTPTKPFHAQRVAIFSDTTGRGALQKEGQRIGDALQALKAEEKAAEEAKEKEGKAPSPSDVARRDSLRKVLAHDQKALSAQEAKRAGKDLNRPLKIELDYLPGTLSLFLRCPEVDPLQIGGYYAEWPKHPIFGPHLPEKVPLLFQRNDIQGGELFARKTVRKSAEGATVSLTFTLWHRPEKAALATN